MERCEGEGRNVEEEEKERPGDLELMEGGEPAYKSRLRKPRPRKIELKG